MKAFKTAFALALVICIAAVCISAYAAGETIENGVLRIHIRANGNSEREQTVKLCVRDSIIESAKKLFENSKSLEESIDIARDNLGYFCEVANFELAALGEDYGARVYLDEEFFPTKRYDDISLPAGIYKALVIELGSGEGENWWCMLYPALCPCGDSAAQSRSTKRELEYLIGEDNYQLVTQNKVNVKFKLVEIWGRIKSIFR